MTLGNYTTSGGILQTDGSGNVTGPASIPAGTTIGTKKIARIYTQNLAGTGTTFAVTHSLDQLDPIVLMKDTTTRFIGAAQFDVTDEDNVQVTFNVTPTSGQFDVIIIG